MDNFYTKLIQEKNEKIPKVIPAYQWGQNETFVFINIKLAMRMDSPGK
jgi:hypothetical protein